jgi:Holliday junction resolvasome RuvABC endonuclease subunit
MHIQDGDLIIGIDPGKDGAVCFMTPTGIEFIDTPTVKANKNGKKNYDLRAMKDLLHERRGSRTLIVLEMARAMPRQSSTTTWAQAMGIAYWEALAVGLELPYSTVYPQEWKKVIPGNRKRDKDGAYWTACNLYPWIRTELKTPRGRLLDGRCDALCMAEWMRREQGAPFTVTPGQAPAPQSPLTNY